jgi:8-oxo-dGTP diphosphatase
MNQFLVGVKCLIKKDNKILLLQRGETAPTNPLLWDLPGGLVDYGEMPDDAIIREIVEETNLKIRNLKLVSSTVFLRKEIPTLVLFYIGDYLDGNVQISSEHQSFEWVELDQLLKGKMQPWIIEHLSKSVDKFE